jgi:predicted acylesterase/phospholipase RssA
MESEIIKIGMNPANVVIRPQVENISAQEFARAKELIQLGEDAANRALDQIKQLFVPLARERAR